VNDVVVRGGRVMTPEGEQRIDLAIEAGRIAAVGPELPGAETEIDAIGLLVLPAVVDVHVHFNEPGRADWEGAATGSRALAAGGGALFVDMPLNSTPCTVNGTEVDRKRAALEAASIADFGLWGGLVPGSVPEMAEMAARGVVGFKAFMCDSGLPEFPRADDTTLLDGLREAARLNLPVAVHAESDEMVRRLAQQAASSPSAGSIRAFLDSRPVDAEVEAIERATQLAGEAGAKLHIVHVSSGRGVTAAVEARARGVDVSIETCPHYLFFVDEDVERLGAVAKCAPPLRPAADHDALWDALEAGLVDLVASDHSPTTPSNKTGDFAAAWGGIAGVQSTLPVLLGAGTHVRGLPLGRIASLLATNPARRFRLAGKGSLAVGHDADIALVDPDARHALRVSDLHQRHTISPYVNVTFRGRVRRTLRRGETIFLDGRITAQQRGRFVCPTS
jgi:allantoinase